ncbi:MAG: hypothetical protein U0V74_01015 [Chitinophagales bacterium]
MKLRTPIIVVSAFVLCIAIVQSCKKDSPLPHNPYDDIVRDDTTANEIPVDSLTITYVHKKLLATRCALPGCHVGNFEPDFRTPQSSFSTLVYAPIVKNNAANDFKYRVIPFDTAYSVLYERITNCCFVNINDRMPQDNIGTALPDSSIKLVAQWIMHGARDMFGNVPEFPNAEPTIVGYLAASTDLQTFYSNTRLDSVPYNPFVLPVSVSSFYVGFQVQDDSTALNMLQFNKLKISTNADDFSSATVVPAVFFNLGGQQAWIATVNPTSMPVGDTLFMRYYVNDGDHPSNTEFPRTESPFPYKSYWSFIRQ